MQRILTALAACLVLTSPASADETWQTPAGTMIYEADLGMVAVLSFPTASAWPRLGAEFIADRGNVYVPGLGGNYDNRSTHDGYWIAPGMPACSAVLTGPDGLSSSRWGRVRITFDRAAFPTGFVMLVGECMAEPDLRVRADLP